MCSEPGCASTAAYLVDGRLDRGGGGPGIFAAYCEEHVQRFLRSAGPEETAAVPRKSGAAAGAGASERRKFA